MPIRFRCPHCSQLLGIARRKAGSGVRCPNCQREIFVPPSSPPEPPAEEAEPRPAPPPPAPSFFERDDFDSLLRGSVSGAVEVARPTPPVERTPVPPGRPAAAAPSRSAPVNVEPWPTGAAPAGLVLSPTRATVLVVVAVVLLAIAFAAGLLIGRSSVG